MLPGPDQVIACPMCQAHQSHQTLRSGNTFGARLYSDGYQYAPMLPTPPPVVRCRACAECFWLDLAADVEEVPMGRGPNPVQAPTSLELHAAFDRLLAAAPERELNLRVYLWWRENDAHRAPTPRPAPIDTVAREANLRALIGLLGSTLSDRLMRGEVLRQLGEFEQAIHTLVPLETTELGTFAVQLKALCLAGEREVVELARS